MRALLLGTIFFTACTAAQTGSRALGPAASTAPATTTTPLPSGVVDPQPLIDRDTKLSAIVLRVDKVTAKLTTMGAFESGTGAVGAAGPSPVWAVAIVGRIRIDAIIDLPDAQCGIFVHDAATGDVRGSQRGSLALCQPYFAESLTPPDAPVRCASDHFEAGVFARFEFTRTRSGPVALTIVRDDAWRAPTIAPGAFLAQAPEASTAYQRAFCITADVRQSPTRETLVASGLGRIAPDRPFPTNGFAIWLRGYHAVRAEADAVGHVIVTAEPRSGFEWAFFDWHALVGTAGYIQFHFVDASGNEILPWIVGNGG